MSRSTSNGAGTAPQPMLRPAAANHDGQASAGRPTAAPPHRRARFRLDDQPRQDAVDGVAIGIGGRVEHACPGVQLRSVGPGSVTSEALGEPGALDRMRAIRARALRRTAAASETPCRDCRGRCGSKAPRTRCISDEVVVAEHLRHVLRLVGADAVLAGQRAAGVDAVARGSRPRPPRPARPDPGSCRRSRSADAGCRRRHGRRCRCAGPRCVRARECGASTSGSRVRGTTPSCT